MNNDTIQTLPKFYLLSPYCIFLFQDPTLHLVLVSHWSLLICDIPQSFHVFHDFDTFNEFWSVIPWNVSPRGFVWSLVIRLKQHFQQVHHKSDAVSFPVIEEYVMSICLLPCGVNYEHTWLKWCLLDLPPENYYFPLITDKYHRGDSLKLPKPISPQTFAHWF